MSQYTMTIKQILEMGHNIFDFEYPIFSDEYKQILENRFIDYFMFREIGVETVGRFKHNLKVKFNLLMPFYNKLYESDLLEQRIMDNYNVTEKYERDITSDTLSNNTSLNLESDTPQNQLDINTNDFVSGINKNTGNQNINNTNKEKWTRTMVGNIGVQTDADAILKYRQTLLKIDQMLFDELSELFMGVY